MLVLQWTASSHIITAVIGCAVFSLACWSLPGAAYGSARVGSSAQFSRTVFGRRRSVSDGAFLKQGPVCVKLTSVMRLQVGRPEFGVVSVEDGPVLLFHCSCVASCTAHESFA